MNFKKTRLLAISHSVCAVLAMLGGTSCSFAQSALPAAPSQTVAQAAATASALVAKPTWQELTETQKATLRPLEASWDSMEAPRKRKWLTVAQSYNKLAPAEQATLQSRMAEWAALSPRERTMARLNYAETKKVAPRERAANWDAYQALSPEERQKFVDRASNRPLGAAVAAKPVPDNKITPVPVTRHTPAHTAPTIAIDRKTLLPQAPRPATVASAPAN